MTINYYESLKAVFAEGDGISSALSFEENKRQINLALTRWSKIMANHPEDKEAKANYDLLKEAQNSVFTNENDFKKYNSTLVTNDPKAQRLELIAKLDQLIKRYENVKATYQTLNDEKKEFEALKRSYNVVI